MHTQSIVWITASDVSYLQEHTEAEAENRVQLQAMVTFSQTHITRLY